MAKILTPYLLKLSADKIHAPVNVLKAFLRVECKEHGFYDDGQPVILFERHKFRERLIANGKGSLALRLDKERPDLCNKIAGGYGASSIQHMKLAQAVKYDRTSALEACSWGIGQVMGYHWKKLGYSSLQAFINAMYDSEFSQLDACIRYLQVNNLVDEMVSRDWDALAAGYNGSNYKMRPLHN